MIEIESTSPGVWKFVRLKERSELKAESYFVSQDIAHSAQLRGTLEKIKALGVHWEQALGGILFLHGTAEQLASARLLLNRLVAGV